MTTDTITPAPDRRLDDWTGDWTDHVSWPPAVWEEMLTTVALFARCQVVDVKQADDEQGHILSVALPLSYPLTSTVLRAAEKDLPRALWLPYGCDVFLPETVTPDADRSAVIDLHVRTALLLMPEVAEDAVLCDARDRVESDDLEVRCDLPPFHPHTRHHAYIPGRDGVVTGEQWWDVDELHRLPADPDRLADLMERIGRLEDIHRRLTAQYGERPADELYDEAHDIVSCNRRIIHNRTRLYSLLAGALSQTRQALTVLGELASPTDLYDIEFADGESHDDLVHFLDGARRSLSMAGALLPTDAEGELKR